VTCRVQFQRHLEWQIFIDLELQAHAAPLGNATTRSRANSAA
jgi:hypothetical protein